jgi:hypothetical protein
MIDSDLIRASPRKVRVLGNEHRTKGSVAVDLLPVGILAFLLVLDIQDG